MGGNLVSLTDGIMVSASEWGGEASGESKRDWAALISRSADGGRTWDAWRRVQGPKDGIYYFDLRISIYIIYDCIIPTRLCVYVHLLLRIYHLCS